jgi:D-aminoacyl-tRNA deacylase
MRLILQRTTSASVTIDSIINGQIENGLVILVGIEAEDTVEDIEYCVKKSIQMRIFNDAQGKMNLSLQDIKGEILLISQFTLYANTTKGNRPSYIQAAPPSIALPIYEQTIQMFETILEKKIQKGIFGADMKVSLVNDGPVTIAIDSKVRQ